MSTLTRPGRAVALLAALASLLFAASALSQDGEQACTRANCYGIDWSLAPIAEVLDLDPLEVSEQGRQPIHYAAYNCSPSAAIISLIERGADPNAPDPQNGLTPLQIAILACRLRVSRVLLEYGADPEATTPDGGGNTLHLALRSRASLDMMRELIDSGADLNRLDDYGNAPLVYFVANENPLMMHAFLDAGANPNVTDRNGRTAAHYAAGQGDLNLLGKLRILGADLGAVTHSGITPLHLAADRGLDAETVALFHLAEVDANGLDDTGRAPIHYAASKSPAPAFVGLVALGADPHLPDAFGDQPLHYALRHNADLEVIRALLSWGADPNRSSADGDRPAIIASRHRNDGALLLLVDYGVELDAVDHNGRSLLHHAVIEGNAAVAASLIDSGADPFLRDAIGNSPAALADRLGIDEPAASKFAAKVAESQARLRLAEEQRLLEAERLAELRAGAAEAATLQQQQRRDRRNQIETEAEANVRLRQIEASRRRAEVQLDYAKHAGNESRVEQYTSELEQINQREQSVADRIRQIREEAKNRRGGGS